MSSYVMINYINIGAAQKREREKESNKNIIEDRHSNPMNTL